MSVRSVGAASYGMASSLSVGRGASARSGSASEGSQALTPQEQQQVAALKETDRKVRAHEQAHISAGGGLVRGGAEFTYQAGPDGQRYAVAGEVSIDTSPGAKPEETLSKAARIRQAALAPADPSAQDRSVAARADQMAAKARSELAEQQAAGAAQSAVPGYQRQAVSAYQGVQQAADRVPALSVQA